MSFTAMKNSNTNSNDNEWSVVNKKTKIKKNVQPIIDKKNRVCMYYARGSCYHKINCNNGLHLSEQERNRNPDIDLCFSYINSPYIHSIEDCIKINGGLCINCAFGNCSQRNTCFRSHNPDIRYENDIKRLNNIYTIPICEDWIDNIWCDGLCYKKHPKQCEHERILSENNKTCPADCKNGFHQGAKICKVIKNNNSSSCETIEEIEIYKIGEKPIQRPFIKKVKKEVKTEEYYYMIDHRDQLYECVDIFKSNNISNDIIIKNNSSIKKKVHKSKEVLYFDDIDINNNELNINSNIIENYEKKNNKLYEIINNDSDNKIENTISINSSSHTRKLTILQRKKQKIIDKNQKRKEKRQNIKRNDTDSDSDNKSNNNDYDSDDSLINEIDNYIK